MNLSSSGSTHFIINKYGDMFTRMFDFDISGLDQFFVYSYEDRRGIPGDPDSIFQVIQLPAEDWLKQPKIITNGKALITDRISIQKTGRSCIHRILRVEGMDEGGETGFYEKDIKETGSASWVFHMHYRETIRVKERAAGIDDESRLFLGAIEAPQEFIDSLKDAPEEVRTFAGKYLGIKDGRFTECRLTVSLSSLKIKPPGFDWGLARDKNID